MQELVKLKLDLLLDLLVLQIQDALDQLRSVFVQHQIKQLQEDVQIHQTQMHFQQQELLTAKHYTMHTKTMQPSHQEMQQQHTLHINVLQLATF